MTILSSPELYLQTIHESQMRYDAFLGNLDHAIRSQLRRAGHSEETVEDFLYRFRQSGEPLSTFLAKNA